MMAFEIDVMTLIKIVGALGAGYIGWRRWVDFESNRLFNKYVKASDFAYKLAEKTNKDQLEALGRKYGIAAFTGDVRLSLKQRERILSATDPIKHIEVYKKCAHLVDVTEQGNELFEWKEKRHNNKAWRSVLKIFYFGIYTLSVMAYLKLPDIVPSFFNMLITKFEVHTLSGKVLFHCVYGAVFFIIAYFGITQGMKIKSAESLIENNNAIRESDGERT
ncbi:hypothetical protein [Kosakonia sacchari]|uniref:hypothetical protein n=1 Tax=Kosakonia sacchari TaxID=1158459 RepID=UPI00136476A4|nr:hypothetical protein [Kosakonia sacchari]QHM95633.1 hypothetical protein FGE25_15750 [Kosakonia sacchari]